MPEWQRKRLEVFQRDNFKCCNCNSTTRQLEVHHVDYVNDWKTWKYPMDMLVTLCRDCHEKEQARPRHETTLLHSMRWKGFTADDMLRLSVAIEQSPDFVTKIKKAISKL